MTLAVLVQERIFKVQSISVLSLDMDRMDPSATGAVGSLVRLGPGATSSRMILLPWRCNQPASDRDQR